MLGEGFERKRGHGGFPPFAFHGRPRSVRRFIPRPAEDCAGFEFSVETVRPIPFVPRHLPGSGGETARPSTILQRDSFMLPAIEPTVSSGSCASFDSKKLSWEGFTRWT